MRCIVDASIAVEYLLQTSSGRQASEILNAALVLTPELLDVEVLSVLRGAVLRGNLDERRAAVAVDDLAGWPIERVPHRDLVAIAWRFRQNISAYDAFYVAAAYRHDAALLTADGPLARAPNLGVVVHNIRVK